VTGTFQHVSNEVISVFVEGESEPIGATSQHPFWSRDRNAFVPAGELRIGEELKTALGTSTRVTSIEIRAGPETVYGLEVAGEHVYQISNAGLLVHNASVTSPYQIDTLHGPRWKDPVTGKFVKAPNYEAHNSATFARYKNELRAAMGKPHVNDSRLSGYMDELYRENASIGSGSTAAAVRHELATGGTVGGKTHSKKAEDMIIALQRWLKNNPNASSGDQSAAYYVLLDMIIALNGK
ncbi:MAG: Hint domain-containing protein, partial [Pseudomonadales bacterium]